MTDPIRHAPIAFDFERTFSGEASPPHECSFVRMDGERIEPPRVFWELAKAAYFELDAEKQSDELNEQDEELSLDEAVKRCLTELEELRQALIIDAENLGDSYLASPGGDPVTPEEIKNYSPITLATLVAHYFKCIAFPKELQIHGRRVCALMTLYAMNDLQHGQSFIRECPDSILEIYCEARNIWLGCELSRADIALQQWRAKSAALNRHRENHDLKSEAIAFYKEQKGNFRSRAAAAAEINKQIPVRERTIYKWLAEADKKN